VFFITDAGFLISNYHVVKEATKIHLVTSVGTVTAKVVQVDAANDLALLKAIGRFAPLPIAATPNPLPSEGRGRSSNGEARFGLLIFNREILEIREKEAGDSWHSSLR
jgi:hypothetical protein